MCTPLPKLYYFDIEGRAEVTRQMFQLASVKFEDVRYSFSEWGNLKATGNTETPFGQLPILKLSKNVTFCQSQAIEYYVAKKYGFLGSSLFDETKIIMISNCVSDILAPVFKLFYLKGDEKELARKKFETENLEDYLQKLTSLLKVNKNNSIYFVGKKLTLADLRTTSMFSFFKTFEIKFDKKKFPELIKLRDQVIIETKLKKVDLN